MRTKILSLLALALLLWCSTFSTTAQNKDTFTEEYLKLKSKKTSFQGVREAEPSLIFLSSTQKLNSESARVRIIVDGKLSGYDFQIQPVQTIKDSSGTITRTENAGELTTSRGQITTDGKAKGAVANPEVIIPISQQADALEISINLQKDKLGNRKLLVPLRDTVETIGVRLFQPTAVTNSSDGCSCPYVELSNDRCGTVGKYCGGYTGNVVNGVECTGTCGTSCTNKDCVALEEGGVS